jgi:uncharacterized membrane protein
MLPPFNKRLACFLFDDRNRPRAIQEGIVWVRPVQANRPAAPKHGALSDYGVNDAFMKELAASLHPGDAALFVEVKKITGDKVLDAIKGTGEVILKTSLDNTKEKALREAIASTPPTSTPATPTA